jgi:biotin carboxyl carrier protein
VKRRPRARAGKTAGPPAAAGRSRANSPFDPQAIKKLVALMDDAGLIELEIERGGARVRLVRAGAQTPPAVEPRRQTRGDARDAPETTSARAITSPMVGTFHRAPAAGSGPFVDVGDVVERGQVLCLIEAMKMMNEIEAEFPGRVREVLIENGKPVEFGEALFLIEAL